jgi:hypothetical protein
MRNRVALEMPRKPTRLHRSFNHVIVEPLELVPEGGFQLVVDKEQAAGYLPSILDAQDGANFGGHFDTLDPTCEDAGDTAPSAVTVVTKSAIEEDALISFMQTLTDGFMQR